MKWINKKSFLASFVAFHVFGFASQALPEGDTSIAQDFEALGGNRVILDRAQSLNPEQDISIVQERVVSRRNRWEIGSEFAGTFGGDTYTKTQSLALNLQYHITPRWSLGLKYAYDFNQLTSEGEAMANRAVQDADANPGKPTALVPAMDYPKTETFALVNWYPIYGKMNVLDKGIAHFDIYALAGVGQVKLSSGTSPSYTAGGGVGFWWTKNFASRLELRYQNYKAKYYESEKSLDMAVASAQMGWLL